jgi:tetratricopeptide (TPR) repeat protein
MRRYAALLLCVLLALRAGTSLCQPAESRALGPLLERADVLVRSGKAEQAWQLLLPLEPQHAGDPRFDQRLAVAALESGRANRATFILERIVAVDPGNVAARLEMGRALFALGDYERAEREFDFVAGSSPPARVQQIVASYREKMREAERAEEAGSVSGYAEVAVGHDTNVTTGAAVGSVFIPSLGAEFVPDGLFTRQADRYAAVAAGVEFLRPLSGTTALFAGGDARRRWHSSLDRLDWQAAEVHLGYQRRLASGGDLRLTVRHNDYELDRARYRTLQSAGAERSRMLGERARVSFSAQGTRIRYQPEDVRASSSDLLGFGGNAAYVLDAPSRTLAFGGIYVGHDNAVLGRADGDRRLYGVSGALQRRLLPRADAYVSLALLNSDYRDVNPDFGDKRKDRQLDLALGASWDLGGGWLLRPQLAFTRNSSNLPLNDYRRTETSLALRRVWQ